MVEYQSGGTASPFDADANIATSLDNQSLADPVIRAYPNGYYRAMRERDPIHFDEGIGMWLVSSYELLDEVLRDPITYSVKEGYEEIYCQGYLDEFKAILERDGGGFFPDSVMSDPPEHNRIRRLMEKAFTTRRVKLLEPRITQVIADLIERNLARGAMDGVSDFAVPMTIGVICEQLGFHGVDLERVRRWTSAVVAQVSKMQTHEQMLANARQFCDLQSYLFEQIERRREAPSEDMLSDLVHAHIPGFENPTLTHGEIVSLARTLLVGGNDTTTSAVSTLLLVLATQPELAERLHASVEAGDDKLLTRFVEELLRIEPPVRGLTRMTIRDVELGGKKLPKGSHLLLLYASANDDEREFPNPRAFDLDRGNIGRHMTFGAGVHRCIGTALARAEVRLAAELLVTHLTDLRLTIPVEEIAYLPTVSTRAMLALPLEFKRR